MWNTEMGKGDSVGFKGTIIDHLGLEVIIDFYLTVKDVCGRNGFMTGYFEAQIGGKSFSLPPLSPEYDFHEFVDGLYVKVKDREVNKDGKSGLETKGRRIPLVFDVPRTVEIIPKRKSYQ